MYYIKIIRADFEGWWLFEEWPENVIHTTVCMTYEELKMKYAKLIHDYTLKFHSFKRGDYGMYAFFNTCEVEYCDDCDEDMQIFYTPLILKEEEVVLDYKFYSI